VWGLVCLLVPLAAIVFLIKFWRDAKVPFLISLAGSVVAVVAVLGLAAYTASSAVEDFAEVTFEDVDEPTDRGQADDWWEDQPPPDLTPAVEPPPETPTEQPVDDALDPFAADDDEPILLEDDTELIADPEIEPLLEAEEQEPEPTPRPRRWREWGVNVPIAELESHIGQRVEIHTTDGRSHKAELEAVGPDSIRVRQRMGAGHVSYSLALDTIVEIRAKE
jgi:hypothetical protein